MKKTNRPRKLTLQSDTVKSLKLEDLAQAVVGASAGAGCTRLTTGVTQNEAC